MPQDSAITMRIDENDRASVRRIALVCAGDIDAGILQRATNQSPVLVASERADIAGAHSERGARRDDGCRLAAAHESPIGDARLSAREHGGRVGRQLQHLIDRVRADP